jgi:GNAT superfamily N-acetyltransferase
MAMRPLKLPDDLVPFGELVTESFHYPENEAWSVQADEQEQLVEMAQNLSRLWPLIRLIQAFSPSLRDLLRGYVWEEEGRLVGLTSVQRRGSTDVWIVGTVGVLPEYRRRGLARELLAAGLALVRECGGTKALLWVNDGNVPAIALYEALGFERYTSGVELQAWPKEAPPAPPLPDGYVQSQLALFDWQPRLELEERILPEVERKYEPVEEGRFRHPAMMRLLYPLLMFAQGMREGEFVIRTARQGLVVARGGYNVPRRGTGVNQLRARLDPAHPDLAPYLVGTLLHQAMTQSPGFRVEIDVPHWMEALLTAFEEAGLERRLGYLRMGVEL